MSKNYYEFVRKFNIRKRRERAIQYLEYWAVIKAQLN